jgi:cytosine deaminase
MSYSSKSVIGYLLQHLNFKLRWLILLHLYDSKRSLMVADINYNRMLDIAIDEAEQGLAEGGIPIGAALFDRNGVLLGRGHNRRVQEGDPSTHGETDAFRNAGRQRSYRNDIMVTTLAPCWYCSGLVRQFNIKTVVVGESFNFSGGINWLRENGVEVIILNSQKCINMMAQYIKANPEVWNEDIGEE